MATRRFQRTREWVASDGQHYLVELRTIDKARGEPPPAVQWRLKFSLLPHRKPVGSGPLDGPLKLADLTDERLQELLNEAKR